MIYHDFLIILANKAPKINRAIFTHNMATKHFSQIKHVIRRLTKLESHFSDFSTISYELNKVSSI
jgi:hypothetical protein